MSKDIKRAAAEVPREPASAAEPIMPGTDFTPAPAPPAGAAGSTGTVLVGPDSGADAAVVVPGAGVVGSAGAALVVPAEPHASAGRAQELGSSWPIAEPRPPSCAGTDAIAVQRQGACD